MVSLEIIALVLTGLSIFASIIYYSNILSNANKAQKIQLEKRELDQFLTLEAQYSVLIVCVKSNSPKVISCLRKNI